MMADVDNEASGVRQMWNRLGVAAKWSLGLGALICVTIAVLLLWWAARTDYQVLFSNLEPTDAATIVQSLKAQKVTYRLDDEGRTIRVPSDRVYETRLALMSSGAPLSGGVGFEIFDRQSLGATEQSQRVAYQRALQGELARTIGALEHVRQAHVLLVLPESTLFKRDQQKSSAAVSLVLDQGAQLHDDQISGIQRLVAAAVSGMDVDQVVITDQRGVTLSMSDSSSLTSSGASARLKLKSELEERITRKITAMLEKMVGPGQAIVSVDATLNFDQITRSLQALVPVDQSDAAKGALVRRREVRNSSRTSLEDDTPVATDSKGAGNSSLDVEYEFGKRLEQVATAPGALVRLSIGVIVPGALSADRESHLLQLIRAAAGADSVRGDVVVLDSLDRFAGPAARVINAGAEAIDEASSQPSTKKISALRSGLFQWTASPLLLVGGVGTVLFVCVALFVVSNRRRLSLADRQALLTEIVTSLDQKGDQVARI